MRCTREGLSSVAACTTASAPGFRTAITSALSFVIGQLLVIPLVLVLVPVLLLVLELGLKLALAVPLVFAPSFRAAPAFTREPEPALRPEPWAARVELPDTAEDESAGVPPAGWRDGSTRPRTDTGRVDLSIRVTGSNT